MDRPHDPVTAHVVDELWVQAIDGSVAAEVIHDRVERLLGRVSAESPVVNWGMTELHVLTRLRRPSRDELVAARDAWMLKVGEYEADPAAWMQRYFVNMLHNYTQRNGVVKGRAFATRLVGDGYMKEGDVPTELRN